jgi:hypothetical protein
MAAVAVLGLSLSPLRADVIMNETLAMKVAHSRVLALARFVAVEGQGPFTNARPPAATFRVSRGLRGCAVGELLRLADWGRSRPPEAYGGKRQLAAEEAGAAHDAWAATVIQPPVAGAEFLLLLDGQGDATQGPAHASFDVPFPNYLPAPDARTIEMVVGLSTFHIDVSTPEAIQVWARQPVLLDVTVRNDTQAAAQFEPSALRLSTTTPKGDLLKALAPAGGLDEARAQLPGLRLAPGEQRAYTWTLSSLFPMVFADAGDYWLEIEVPAQGGDRIARHVEVVESSLDYACGRAVMILRTRVAPDGVGQVTLADPVYLRLRGERLPPRIAWPAATAVPAANERVFLCGSLAGITWIEPDGLDVRRRIQSLIDGDAPDQWPRDEERDPRFAPSADAPAVEQRRIGIEKRLETP